MPSGQVLHCLQVSQQVFKHLTGIKVDFISMFIAYIVQVIGEVW